MDVKYSVERTQYLYTTRKPEHRYKIYHDDHTSSTLPPEVIKKIAEDVKAMILRDLKRKTTTMLPVTIEKGLEALIPRYNAVQNLIPRYNAVQNLIPSYNPEQNLIPRYNAEQNMAKPYPLTKILDILQKYRNGENPSVYRKPSEAVQVYTTPKQPQNQNKYPYYLPVESKPLKLENKSPYINPYKIYKSVQSKKISPRFKYEVQKPKTFAPKRDLPPLKSYTSNNLKSTAITLQTNLIEIPPIGIPISEPVAFLNHHVIITTRRPFRNKQQNYPLKNDMKLKYNNPIIKHKPVRTRNVNPRINTNIRYDNYYNNKKQPEPDKKRMSDVDESREIKTTKPRGVYRPRSQSNIKKFHEKLEQYPKMKYKEVNVDCCKDEIFTSEQILEDEMRSRDEVSFRNLLKTQQKVTDMLTQMLAKRKKEDLPLSVEAA
ncbi:hypothetical protein RR48_03027 [Papilio machaon]|uniref:Uncharacterized protein n=1 Tax=Papilio machaon TaxID=76193 RepID=A0A0N0PCG7_PAPMA|nr:hypothetical protein RR48_03027 [Papilio machaon]